MACYTFLYSLLGLKYGIIDYIEGAVLPLSKGDFIMYPEWVTAQKKKGQTIKKVGNRYYLYERTSKYVKGAKYPKTVDTYLGTLTPEGLIPAKTKKVSIQSAPAVREYGYSYSIEQLLPEMWKFKMGSDWRNILANLIIKNSPNSYLLDWDGYHPLPSEKLASARASLLKDLPVRLKDLEPLLYVYLVQFQNQKAVSEMNEEQKELLEELGVKLEAGK